MVERNAEEWQPLARRVRFEVPEKIETLFVSDEFRGLIAHGFPLLECPARKWIRMPEVSPLDEVLRSDVARETRDQPID